MKEEEPRGYTRQGRRGGGDLRAAAGRRSLASVGAWGSSLARLASGGVLPVSDEQVADPSEIAKSDKDMNMAVLFDALRKNNRLQVL